MRKEESILRFRVNMRNLNKLLLSLFIVQGNDMETDPIRPPLAHLSFTLTCLTRIRMGGNLDATIVIRLLTRCSNREHLEWENTVESDVESETVLEFPI